jgi:hypothetical protein
MKIENIHMSTVDGWRRLTGTLVWEVAERKPYDLYFEVPESQGDHLQLSSEAFLAASAVPAAVAEERRLKINDTACPIFLDGMLTNLDYFKRWFSDWHDIEVQVDQSFGLTERSIGHTQGMLFSGGIDSQFTLYRWNTELPEYHPARIKLCFIIDYEGFRANDPGNQRPYSKENFALFDRHCELLEVAAKSVGAKLCPIRTNIKGVNDHGGMWIKIFHGAAMAAVSHAVGRNLAAMRFASGDIPLMKAYGSHPLTDPNWSSYRLSISHDTMRCSRFEKTGKVAEWPEGQDALRVCISNTSDRLNCGRCEKCLRTMLMLLCHDKLVGASFPRSDVSVEDLSQITFHAAYEVRQYRALLPELRRIGRQDLHRTIQSKIRQFTAKQRENKS